MVQHDVGVHVLADVNVAHQDVMMSGDQNFSAAQRSPVSSMTCCFEINCTRPSIFVSSLYYCVTSSSTGSLLGATCSVWYTKHLETPRILGPLQNCLAVTQETKRASNDPHRHCSDITGPSSSPLSPMW